MVEKFDGGMYNSFLTSNLKLQMGLQAFPNNKSNQWPMHNIIYTQSVIQIYGQDISVPWLWNLMKDQIPPSKTSIELHVSTFSRSLSRACPNEPEDKLQ